jgi:hypothetical protein
MYQVDINMGARMMGIETRYHFTCDAVEWRDPLSGDVAKRP